MPPVRELTSVDALLEPERLASILDAPGEVEVEALSTLGYSGSRFHRVTVRGAPEREASFIVKTTDTDRDWFSRRTGDRVGREAAALLAPELDEIHEIFHLPYRAVAAEGGRCGVLMDDVAPWLLPDERAPLAREDEELILDTLARLHATFWRSSALEGLPWLHTPADFLHIMGPRDHRRDDGKGESARQVQDAIREGWRAALDLLPEKTRRALSRPAPEIAGARADLPLTLVHGDTKVANFAVLPGSRLAALDWAFVGRAPCTFELGWYVAVNASRLTGGKEEILERYRTLLEGYLGRAIGDDLWDRLEEAGVVCGALMLLWSKGAAVKAGRDGADEEWAWWAERLNAWADGSGADGSLAVSAHRPGLPRALATQRATRPLSGPDSVNSIPGDVMSDDASNPERAPDREQPETFRARSLAASLTVDDLQESLEWYRDVVGFMVEHEHERDGEVVAVELRAGDARIVLGQDDGARGWDRDKGEGFSLHFSTAQDVDERAKLIRERGGTLETEPTDMPWGARAFRIVDPTGFKLTISSEG